MDTRHLIVSTTKGSDALQVLAICSQLKDDGDEL